MFTLDVALTTTPLTLPVADKVVVLIVVALTVTAAIADVVIFSTPVIVAPAVITIELIVAPLETTALVACILLPLTSPVTETDLQ